MSQAQVDHALIDIIVGGQFGAEGKGLIEAYQASEYGVAVRSAHQMDRDHHFEVKGVKHEMKVLPSAWINPKCHLIVGPGAVFAAKDFFSDLDVIRGSGLPVEGRISVDQNAVVGVADGQPGVLAGAVAHLDAFVDDTSAVMQFLMEKGHRVLVEGPGGALSSRVHGYRPITGNSNAIASSLLSAAGLPPTRVNTVLMVIRPFPVRFDKGPFGDADELSWGKVMELAGVPKPIIEQQRDQIPDCRIAYQDPKLIERAIALNDPQWLAVTCLDNFSFHDSGVSEWKKLTKKSKEYLIGLRKAYRVPIALVATGPEMSHVINTLSIPEVGA